MKAKLRHFVSALAILAIALSSCSKSKVYEQVIPDDADFVIAISVDQLVKKSEIRSSENKALREVIFSKSKGQGLQAHRRRPEEVWTRLL